VDTKGEDDTLTTTWVRIAYFGEDAESLSGKLQKGAEVYCEGILRLDTWIAKDGVRRSGLATVAWKVVPLGQIGRKRPGRSAGVQPGGFRQCA
jgi:single-stranded DNA-binding protein